MPIANYGGGSFTNNKGKIMEELANSKDLIILNSGEPTHISMATGHTSAIDLTIASTNIATALTWSTYKDLSFSDHLPIVVTTITKSRTQMQNQIKLGI